MRLKKSMGITPDTTESLSLDAWRWTSSHAPISTMTYTFHYITGAFGLVLMGCLGTPDHSRDAATDLEREIQESLDGMEFRLQRMQSADSTSDSAEETLGQLRSHREAIRKELDRVVATRDTAADSIEIDLRLQLEDLAIRYETVRLGRFKSRDLFEKAVDARFEDLDRELALLEGDVFQEDLRNEFEPTLAHLYGLRNDVALLLAETSAAPNEDFEHYRKRLAAAIGRLDIMLAHATVQVDRAFDAKHPVRSINKLWL